MKDSSKKKRFRGMRKDKGCFKKISIMVISIIIVCFLKVPYGVTQTLWENLANSHFDHQFLLSNGKEQTELLSTGPSAPVKRPLKRKKTKNGKSQSILNMDKIQGMISRKAGRKDNRRSKRPVTDSQLFNLHAITNENKDGDVTQVIFNQANGTPNMIKIKKPEIRKGGRYRNLQESSGKAAENFLTENHALLKVAEPLKELVAKKQWQDELGLRHYRYQQTYKGVPIWGKEVTLHEDAEDMIYLFQGCYEPTPHNIDTNPTITAHEALAAAMEHLEITEKGSDPAEGNLVIYTKEDGQMVLAYKVEISLSFDQSWIYFIDAKNGFFIHRISNIQNSLVTASSIDLSGTMRNFNAWFDGYQYNLIDSTFPLYNVSNTSWESFGNTYICSYNYILEQLIPINSIYPSWIWDPAGVSAMIHTKTIYDYYKNTHNRDGIDDNNMNFIVVVHQGTNNAGWSPTSNFVVLGDGDGQEFADFAGALDTLAHEIQHGITQYSAGLIYENQSGALNEAYSDIFACMVDRDDWTIGEDIYLKSPGYLRNLANPKLGQMALPIKMSEYIQFPNTEEGDHGGVHTNMSIPSRAAYLIADGLTVEGLGKSIGREKTEKIFYRALTTYLNQYAQFLDARSSTIQAAEDLYGAGSTEVAAVQSGWDAVEVTEGDIGAPDDQVPTSTDTVIGQDLVAYLYPTDGTHDKLYDPNETYDLYVQFFSSPFTGYDSDQDFGPLNAVPVAYTRPAVYSYSDESVILYVGNDNNLYGVYPDGSNHTQITTTGDVYSIAISPDGRYFIYTSTIYDDPNIYLLDLDTESSTVYRVIPHSTQHNGDFDLINNIVCVDSLAFDYTSKIVLFDVLCNLPTPEDPDGEGYQYYSIGFLDISKGEFVFPFPTQNPLYDIGNPLFASNNSYVIACDIIDYSNYDQGGTISSGVYTFDFLNQELAEIANPNLGSNTKQVWGVPSFWGNDDYITIQMLSDNDGKAYRIPINSTWVGNPNSAELLNDFDVAMPIMHRQGTRSLTANLQSSSSSLDFGSVSIGQAFFKNLVLTNNGNRDINIESIALSTSTSFTHNGINALLPRNKSMTIRITFAPSQANGSEASNLSIISDADVPTKNISLTGMSITPGTGGSVSSGGGGCFIATTIAFINKIASILQ